MTSTTAFMSIYRLKNQAKILRESLGKTGVEVSHSFCLEAVAKMHGFKDWNVASAKASEESKIFLVNCSFDELKNSGRMIDFQYVVKARSSVDVEKMCFQTFTQLQGKMGSFDRGTEIYVHGIIELSEISELGLIVNWCATDHNGDEIGRFRDALPLATGDCKVEFHALETEKNSNDTECKPFMIL